MTTTIDDLLTTWVECERTGDVSGLDGLLADDFVGVGPIGFVLDKASWLHRFEMGLGYSRLELDEVTTHRHGDTAVVVARQHAEGAAGAMPAFPDLRVSFTVVVDEDRLRIAGMQYSFNGMPDMAAVR
jgi:ketosteroid isomerase-like protein